MDKIVVERKKWLRGKRPWGSPSMLLNHSGEMCCLGFVAKQLCEVDDISILGIREPSGLSNVVEPLNESCFVGHDRRVNSDLTEEAMLINDDSCMCDKEREERLIDLFKAHNIELLFI